MQKRGFFGRIADLWRGFWGVKLNVAEAKNAELVYHNAVRTRTHQQEKLHDAVTRLAYLRNKVEVALTQRREDLALVESALTRAAHDDEDLRALALIRKQRTLQAEVERLEMEHGRLGEQTETAKETLADVRKAIGHLKQERDEMLARKQHAMARIQVASVLQESLGDMGTTDQALENVRESILRMETQAGLDSEPMEANGEVSIATLRREAADESDREALSELKLRLGKHLLPEASGVVRGDGRDAAHLTHIEAPMAEVTQ